MKNVAILCLSSLFLSAPVFAEDYYVPVKKELEPLARLPLPVFEMNDQKISYTLPMDITGREVKVELEHDANDQTFPRIFKGPLATASCMGDNKLPACVITHKNLNIDRNQVDKFLGEKYRDPAKLEAAKQVGINFSSGNEPIGFISKRAIIEQKDVKKWNIRVGIKTKTQAGIPAAIEYAGVLDLANSHISVEGNGQFRLANIVKHGQNLSAYLVDVSGSDEPRLWIDLVLSSDGSAISGTWGQVSDGTNKEKMADIYSLSIAQ